MRVPSEVVLGLVALLVGALGFAALTTGLRTPTEPRGIALTVVGLATLIAVCWVCDARRSA